MSIEINCKKRGWVIWQVSLIGKIIDYYKRYSLFYLTLSFFFFLFPSDDLIDSRILVSVASRIPCLLPNQVLVDTQIVALKITLDITVT